MMTTVISRSLRQWLLSAAVVTLAGLASPAAAEFRGAGVLYSFMGCEDLGWGDDYGVGVRAVFVPRERVGGEFSAVSLHFPGGGSTNLQFRGEFEPGAGFRRIPGRSIWSLFTVSSDTRVRVMERTVLQPPGGTFDEATQLRLRLRIRNFLGVEDCQADAGLVFNVAF